jgi:hypothetical protein
MLNNKQRIGWAKKAVEAYMTAKKEVEPVDDCVITDLLTDLLHLGASLNIAPQTLIQRAIGHHDVETTDDDNL